MNFQQGLNVESALSNSNVIGNNVANANMTGFRHCQVQFADVRGCQFTFGQWQKDQDDHYIASV